MCDFSEASIGNGEFGSPSVPVSCVSSEIVPCNVQIHSFAPSVTFGGTKYIRIPSPRHAGVGWRADIALVLGGVMTFRTLFLYLIETLIYKMPLPSRDARLWPSLLHHSHCEELDDTPLWAESAEAAFLPSS